MKIKLRGLHKRAYFAAFACAIFLGISLSYFSGSLMRLLLQTDQKVSISTIAAGKGGISSLKRKREPFSKFENTAGEALFRSAPLPENSPDGVGETSAPPVDQVSITLLGVISGAPDFARALIRDKSSRKISSYAIGDTIGGAKIRSILYDGIVLIIGGRRVRLGIGEKTSGNTAGPGKKGNSIKSPRKGSVVRTTISRTRLNRYMRDEKKFISGISMSPVRYKGRMMGLRILRLKRDHVLHQMGARPRDIIRRFNGQLLDSQAKLISIYQALKSASLKKATVVVERGGKILNFEFAITD